MGPGCQTSGTMNETYFSVCFSQNIQIYEKISVALHAGGFTEITSAKEISQSANKSANYFIMTDYVDVKKEVQGHLLILRFLHDKKILSF